VFRLGSEDPIRCKNEDIGRIFMFFFKKSVSFFLPTMVRA